MCSIGITWHTYLHCILIDIFYVLCFFSYYCFFFVFFFFSSRRRHTRCGRDWSSDVCSSDLAFTVLPFARFLLNTILVAIFIMIGQILSCTLGAFAFARLKFPGSDLIFSMYLSTLMVPEIVRIIPNFILIKSFNWIDIYKALIVPNLFGTAFGTFLLRQFFFTIPEELIEAAKLDGYCVLRIIFKIIMPLSKPALTSLGIYVLVQVWNDFMWPLTVINSTEMKTLAIGLTSFQGLVVNNWGVIMAGAVYTMVPMVLVFLFAQKYFIEGMTMTGLK